MRAAAIDLGKTRVGLAISDELGLMAHPRQHLSGKDPGRLVETLTRFAEEEQVTLFLVGLPVALSGREGPPATRARRFAARLQQRSGREVELIDERLSTREAQRRLHEQGLDAKKSRDKIDSASAAVLLQAWLDARRDSPE
jgi:putative Holliday junction resolvase